MDSLIGWKKDGAALHYVLGATKQNLWLAKLINANLGVVSVIDSRYKGGEITDGIRYTNMKLARATFDLPAKLYFHSYMDPKNRKRK